MRQLAFAKSPTWSHKMIIDSFIPRKIPYISFYGGELPSTRSQKIPYFSFYGGELPSVKKQLKLQSIRRQKIRTEAHLKKRPTNNEVHWFSNHPDGKLALFMKKKYNYRHMYRYYFGTIRFLDWVTICRNKLITLNTLRTIVAHDFNLKGINQMNFDQICSKVILLADNEVKKYDNMLKSIYMQSRIIIDQPGGLSHIRNVHSKNWRNQLIVNRKKNFEQGPHRIVDTRREILKICQIPAAANREILVDLIWTLGLRQYLPAGITKSSSQLLCQILQKYYSAVTEKPFLPPETEALLEEEINSIELSTSSISSSDLSSIESNFSSIESINSPIITYPTTIKYPAGTAPKKLIEKIQKT